MTTRRFEKTMMIINNHPGKRKVYETFQATNPALAEKYFLFISKHQAAQYITWDASRERFVA